MMRTGVIVAAGGSSTRFGSNKLFAELDHQPLFCHCLRTFAAMDPGLIVQIVLVVPEKLAGEYRDRLPAGLRERVQLVSGGSSRTESVWNGLRALRGDVGIAAVQDAARPYTTTSLLLRCIESAETRGSGVAAHRCTDTVKQVDEDGAVRQTLDRRLLWAAETPQVFRRELLEQAYASLDWRNLNITDDAQLVELSGRPVFLVENREENMKITYSGDLSRK